MTETMFRNLLEMLPEVSDFQNTRGIRHTLSAILGLVVSQCCADIEVIVNPIIIWTCGGHS